MDLLSRSFLAFLFLGLTVIFYSCGNGTKDPILDPNDLDDSSSAISDSQIQTVQQIFINVPSPIEMASILQRSGASYDYEVLNSVDNIEKYNSIGASALNLGVYGADLSYTRMFDQIQESVNYLAVIRRISDKLGIPQDEGSFTVAKLEENIENKDTLLSIISDTYASADTYLKENDRGSTAALIILGGWVEAQYIATHIIDKANPNSEILDRIAEQKYSLDNMVMLLEVYKDEAEIVGYLADLAEMKVAFNKIEITQTPGEIVTDTVKKTTTIGGNQVIKMSLETLQEITTVVEKIRNKIIS